MLNPLLCGKWNGHTLWLQWSAPDGRLVQAADTAASTTPTRYRVEIAVRAKPDDAVKWKLIDKGVTERTWMVLPIWRSGAMVQARVSVAGQAAEPGELAQECLFVRSRCLFNFQASARRDLRFAAKTTFHCYVDGAACSYFTDLKIQVPAGETQPATLQALQSSGWNQIDKAADFVLTPEPGARIWNAEASRNDVSLTGRDYTVLEVMPADGPLAVVYCPRNPNVR